jgi:hypothetical protein
VTWLLIPLLQIFSIRWCYGVGLFRAFLSVHLIHWLLALVGATLALAMFPWLVAVLLNLGL